MQNISSSAAFADSKPHYELLDGLRGIAALLVIWYHIFEGFATSPIDQRFNHGYLAVDFFFILSGFVVGYAYDDRWKTTMNTKDFFKRRLIRLHPMVILGAVLGAITFCIQGCEKWDGTQVSISMVMLALLLNLFLIPAVPGSGSEVRGNGEMYPLNLYNESEGTIKSIMLFIYAKTAIYKDGMIVIDELNVKLHPLLLKFIIDLFYNNDSKAQLIYTTHDTTLMDKKFFRRDQIWFVQKDNLGHSELCALSDFKVRSDASFEKDYLSGVYGGIPFLKDFSLKAGE